MTKLGITNFEQKAGELSGGQRKRLALVAALLVPCDVLILDEPTNHLDSAMADWLEDFLKKWRGALIMVTHDRYFLDSVCNRIVEVDKGSIYSYDANYSGYLELKAEREEMQQASDICYTDNIHKTYLLPSIIFRCRIKIADVPQTFHFRQWFSIIISLNIFHAKAFHLLALL